MRVCLVLNPVRFSSPLVSHLGILGFIVEELTAFFDELVREGRVLDRWKDVVVYQQRFHTSFGFLGGDLSMLSSGDRATFLSDESTAKKLYSVLVHFVGMHAPKSPLSSFSSLTARNSRKPLHGSARGMTNEENVVSHMQNQAVLAKEV